VLTTLDLRLNKIGRVGKEMLRAEVEDRADFELYI